MAVPIFLANYVKPVLDFWQCLTQFLKTLAILLPTYSMTQKLFIFKGCILYWQIPAAIYETTNLQRNGNPSYKSIFNFSSKPVVPMKIIHKLALMALALGTITKGHAQIDLEVSPHDLYFEALANTWDEGIPLGNGMVGALLWQKEGKLRLSLDRADLWDLRPMENLKTPEWKFKWVQDQWEKDTYDKVQDNFDVPYDKSPAPSKIPGAALEFDISSLGPVASVRLYLKSALCEIKWKNGARLLTFVHATAPMGWYRFEGLTGPLPFGLVRPAYTLSGAAPGTEIDPVTGSDLVRLGYPSGTINKSLNSITYDQEGWGGFKYQVATSFKIEANSVEGGWSISSEFLTRAKEPNAENVLKQIMGIGLLTSYGSHKDWWKEFWSKSSLSVPNTFLERQWHLEQYKFGSAARAYAPPISLQAIWTADNGKLPPWKGDFHHDLNTQLSYWPAYSGNHLEEEMGFIDWLWKYRGTFKKYTQEYFETEGLNVPGVTTLTGDPMGGWIQYAFGPTVSAWLGQHFYLHWRYSMDREFLVEMAYPWLNEVAIYLTAISQIGDMGYRKLPLSSSPEIFNNSKEAWFGETTNFDLAFIRWTYEKAAELAQELGLGEQANKWRTILGEWPPLAIDENTGLMLGPALTYQESHRHFSHLVGFHPLGIVDFSKGENDHITIINTLNTLESVGSSEWVGYSFSWLANLKARALDGEGAEKALEIFSKNFCLPNSFHVNGDQSGLGYSNFRYRPFTLEGNFAFAAGLQDMLIQSHTGSIHIFPAIPKTWSDVSFMQLRAEGAFLVSATLAKGQVTQVNIQALQGGTLKLKNPFKNTPFESSAKYTLDDDKNIIIETKPNESIGLKPKN